MAELDVGADAQRDDDDREGGANVQLSHWQTDPALWAHTMEVCPDSFIAPVNRASDLGRSGYVLSRRAEELREQGDTARAAQLDAQRRQNYEQATVLLEHAIRIKPTYITARHNAFINYLRLGRSREAVEHLEAMLAANDLLPESIRSNFNTYHDTAGILWMRVGRYDRAARHFEKMLAAVPNHKSATEGLAEARRKLAEAQLELRSQD